MFKERVYVEGIDFSVNEMWCACLERRDLNANFYME